MHLQFHAERDGGYIETVKFSNPFLFKTYLNFIL